MDLFLTGPHVDLMAVLANREWRSSYQDQLEAKYPTAVVISVKLNIPGAIKNNDYLGQIFQTGWQLLLNRIQRTDLINSKLAKQRPTGPEGFLVVKGKLAAVKRMTVEFEDQFLLGRLFDIDVMAQTADSYQLSRQALGYSARTCLVCDLVAKDCIKAERHDLASIYQAIEHRYEDYYGQDAVFEQFQDTMVVREALAALLYEVTVTPKPGLVDPASNGAHDDMDAFTFVNSSLALQPYFNRAYALGQNFQETNLTTLFEALRRSGQQAEVQMYLATQGVNTHKGAVFSLGILVCAYAYATRNGATRLAQLRQVIQAMTQGLIERDLQGGAATTAGEQQYQRYQLTGIRGEAAQAFPLVMEQALPYLRQSHGTNNQRLLDTLMLISGQLADSTLIKRAQNPAILNQMRAWSAEYFQEGGSHTVAGMKFLTELDQQFIKQHLSIGGAADNLILTTFLARLEGVL